MIRDLTTTDYVCLTFFALFLAVYFLALVVLIVNGCCKKYHRVGRARLTDSAAGPVWECQVKGFFYWYTPLWVPDSFVPIGFRYFTKAEAYNKIRSWGLDVLIEKGEVAF